MLLCGCHILSLQGADAIPFLESLIVGDVAALKDGTGTLSMFTNEKGGIIDDTVVTRVTPNHIYLVVNAGCREKDLGMWSRMAWLAPSERTLGGYQA